MLSDLDFHHATEQFQMIAILFAADRRDR